MQSKFRKDFGIRAALSLLALAAFEGLLLLSIVLLWRGGQLDPATLLAILALGQTPAGMALAFYFFKPQTPPSTGGGA